jgi:hypothetical protein
MRTSERLANTAAVMNLSIFSSPQMMVLVKYVFVH